MSGMYPSGDDQPLRGVIPGERIEHKLMPGFPMTVQDIDPCETGPGRDDPHVKYQITDPDGNTDWLCAYDCRKA